MVTVLTCGLEGQKKQEQQEAARPVRRAGDPIVGEQRRHGGRRDEPEGDRGEEVVERRAEGEPQRAAQSGPKGRGVVRSCGPGSAADRAGLKAGDVVLKFNGKPVAGAGELAAMVGQSRPGDRAELEVWRRGTPLSLSATLGEAPRADAREPRGGRG